MKTIQLGYGRQIDVEDTDEVYVDGNNGNLVINGESKCKLYDIDTKKKNAFDEHMHNSLKEGK